MSTRRNFIKGTMVSGLFLPAAFASQASTTAVNHSRWVMHAVYDPQISQSCEFAEQVCSFGGSAHALDEDLARVWHTALLPQLKAGAVMISGLTDEVSMFILHQFARTRDLDFIYKGTHEYLTEGRLSHQLCSSLKNLSKANSFESCAENWPKEIAAMLPLIQQSTDIDQAFRSTTRLSPAVQSPQTLVSWLMAPIHQ